MFNRQDSYMVTGSTTNIVVTLNIYIKFCFAVFMILVVLPSTSQAALVTPQQSVVFSFDTSALGALNLDRFGYDAYASCPNVGGAPCLLVSGGSFDLLFGTSFAGDDIGQSSFTSPFRSDINNMGTPLIPNQAILGTIDTLFATLVYGDDVFAVDNLYVAYGGDVRVYGQFAGVSAAPIPAAIWLFGTALIGLVGFSKRKSRVAA
jgi:hypothetical protein